MTSYNPNPKYLERAINSLLCQKVQDWELLLIDNGSKVPIENLIPHFESDDRIKIFRFKSNASRSEARNYGLEKSAGKYLMFLDDDDWIASKKFGKYLPKLSEGYNFIYSNYVYYDENNNPFTGKYAYRLERIADDPVFYLVSDSNLLIHPPVFDATLVKEKRIQFYKGALNCEDWGFFLKLFLLNKSNLKIFYINETLNYIHTPRDTRLKSRSKSAWVWRRILLMDLIDLCREKSLIREGNIFHAMILYDTLVQIKLVEFLRNISIGSVPNLLRYIYRFLEGTIMGFYNWKNLGKSF